MYIYRGIHHEFLLNVYWEADNLKILNRDLLKSNIRCFIQLPVVLKIAIVFRLVMGYSVDYLILRFIAKRITLCPYNFTNADRS